MATKKAPSLPTAAVTKGIPIKPALEKALEKAVEEENYEGASFIRDEMKRRQEEKDEKNLTDWSLMIDNW